MIDDGFAKRAAGWVSDVTYVWTDEGWLYLAVVMDLYSLAIVGWSMDKRMTQQLVCDALTMALFRRGFPKGVIIHSDSENVTAGSFWWSDLFDVRHSWVGGVSPEAFETASF